MATPVRQPAVAGSFYPGDPESLRLAISRFTATAAEKSPAIGCVVPHAGYMYSGHVAGAVYASIQLPARYIILCPNHTGVGEPLAIMRQGSWLTPLGHAQVDEDLADALVREFDLLADDESAHRSEHALEVQIPFLQLLRGDFRFVPIAVGAGRYDVLHELGEAMARVIVESAAPVLIVASSDMNHYEPDSITREKDKLAIEALLALDARGLYDTIHRHHISMCGFGPAVVMLTAARQMGATSARLVKYATSGDVNRQREAVVGYAGIVVA